jgi:hypothetical protein
MKTLTLERAKFIAAFWQKTTGRRAPLSIEMLKIPRCIGAFYQGSIFLHPTRADDLTMFHELAHLEQWQDGRLVFVPDPLMGNSSNPRFEPGYYMFDGVPVHEKPYDEQPAEIHAKMVAAERLENFQRCRSPFESFELTNRFDLINYYDKVPTFSDHGCF